MRLSVIIPCFNAASTINVQLEALANQHWTESWEIIVSDNGSTDESVAIVEKYQQLIPNLRIIDASKQRGAAYARNLGAKVAKGHALAFVDADDEVAPGWLVAIGEALSKNDFVAGQKDFNKLSEPWVVECCGFEEGEGILENPYLPFAGSGILGIKRSLHDAVGGFDETLLQVEDVDYCWRVQLAGIKLHYAPEALVYIRARGTLAGLYRQSWAMGKSEALLYKKHRLIGRHEFLSWKSLSKTCVILPLQLLFLQVHDKKSLSRWLRAFAWRSGQFQGCIKYQCLSYLVRWRSTVEGNSLDINQSIPASLVTSMASNAVSAKTGTTEPLC